MRNIVMVLLMMFIMSGVACAAPDGAPPRVALLSIGQADAIRHPDVWGITTLDTYEALRTALTEKMPAAEFLSVKENVDVLIKLNQAELNRVGLDNGQMLQLLQALSVDYVVVFRDAQGLWTQTHDVTFSPQVLIFSKAGLLSVQTLTVLVQNREFKPEKYRVFIDRYFSTVADHVAATGVIR